MPELGAKGAVLLHERDNILIACRNLRDGETVEIDGAEVRLSTAIEVGHKLARVDLPIGAKITRYGAPIGSLTASVARGEHVHTHNLQSDYIPMHDRQAVGLKGTDT